MRFLRVTPLVLVLTTTLACGSSSSGDEPAAASSGGGAFPVTIAHKYGSTTITAEPKRIVTVGLTEQDPLVALGVVPVATTEWLGGYPGAIGPWAQPKLGGAAPPEVLKDAGDGPQFEKIAALKPDLILGLYSGLTKEAYGTLSQIAPTVAQPAAYGDYGIPWQELTEKVGQAVGKPEQAKQLVQDAEAAFTAAKQANPAFAGKTALMATPYDGIFVYGSEDPRSRMLTSLGFSLPADLDKVLGDKVGANISRERTDLLDRDALVWIVPNVADDAKKLHGDSVYNGLNVVKQGREVYIDETGDYGNAISFVSALSLPYVLERLVPQLAAAADGNPATPVTPA
ncbi:iron-siderophore ABC transporter substrate-binding protein [Phytohabitans rumicis]|uniref:ABC transporter substrate-binding protein n=1 Tax=Phytohabitans rumicis TaxID=1076125 RepID=A0A6V8LJ13_9ACTN|nr:iron-siderophore ABC transporter substrate-binding protein [Phytohabitans rumicis]GFJ94838.1 ABC transporter substrate-binding protein [Phytohabitans rumicis]